MAGAWLRQAEAELPLTSTPAALLGEQGRALVLAPHPDDESLGCGGLLAACAALGFAAHVIIVSDGSGSHPRSRSFPAARLAALRQQEARAAMAALGLDPAHGIDFLDLPDTRVPSGGPAFDAALTGLLRRVAVPPTATFTTWRHDPHADHAATFALARGLTRALPQAPRLYAYPVWGLAFAHPIPGFPLPLEPQLTTPPRGWRLDITPWLAAKRAAIAAHVSQLGGVITDDETAFRLPAAALALADRNVELFLQEPSP